MTTDNILSERECESQPLLSNNKSKQKNQQQSKNDSRIVITQKVGYLKKKRLLKELKEYYEYQNNLLQCYNEDDAILNNFDAKKLNDENDAKTIRQRSFDKKLVVIIFTWNVVMLFGNLAASILSASYSVISAFIDCAMDITSSVIVFFTIWAINKTNKFNYPRGRQRLEIVSVIVCSVIMGVTNIMMILQSVQAILTDTVNPDANLPALSIIIINIIVKTVFMLICYRQNTSNSLILALDQRNDIITSIVAMGGALIGDHFYKYADPIGAILVCTFIAISWFSNAFENIPLIVGRRAEQERLSRILRIAMKHDDRIICLDHIMCYHVGEKAIVEIHVVLDEHLPLKITHDVTEALARKINSLDFVERVFVHVDYWCDGKEDGE